MTLKPYITYHILLLIYYFRHYIREGYFLQELCYGNETRKRNWFRL